MTADTRVSGDVEVTQADRELYLDLTHPVAKATYDLIRSVRNDNSGPLQRIARHRLSTATPPPAQIEAGAFERAASEETTWLREVIEAFASTLTNNGTNKRNCLSFNHDKLVECLGFARLALKKRHKGFAALRAEARVPASGGVGDAQDDARAIIADLIRLADMGLEESLKEPEENGNYAAYERAKRYLAASPPAAMENK